jgi:ABC-type dipeptide/oligopeptide/nickel transport system permease subunit
MSSGLTPQTGSSGLKLRERYARFRTTERYRTIRRFVTNRLFVVGVLMLAPLAFMAIFAPSLAPYDPLAINVDNNFSAPNADHLLGTDELGRDVLSRVLYGAQISLRVGGLTAAMTCLLGLVLGAITGYKRGIDVIVMRVMDGLMAFPGILLAIIIVAAIGQGELNVVVAMSIIYTPRITRVVRSTVIEVKEQDYVDAARLVGLRDVTVLGVHILPNCLAPLIVQTTFGFAWAILVEASLSFVGLGTPPPAPSWGNIISAGRSFIRNAPWLVVTPGLAISVAVLALNLIGDGLRDILDPRLRNISSR